MNNELRHTKEPSRQSWFWFSFYLGLIALVVVAFNLVSSQLRTHSLPTGKISLSTNYSKYLLGETISFTLTNNYNSSVYLINNCPEEPLEVYRQVANKWIREQDKASIWNCPTEQRQIIIPAGKSVTGNFSSWENLFSHPGKYRIVAYVEYYSSVLYQDIEIIEQPKPTNNTSSNTTNSSQNTTTVPKTNDDDKDSDENKTEDQNEQEIEIENEPEDD